jgi:hypothetical protein
MYFWMAFLNFCMVMQHIILSCVHLRCFKLEKYFCKFHGALCGLLILSIFVSFILRLTTPSAYCAKTWDVDHPNGIIFWLNSKLFAFVCLLNLCFFMPYSAAFCPVYHYDVVDMRGGNAGGMGGQYEDKLIKGRKCEECMGVLQEREQREKVRLAKVQAFNEKIASGRPVTDFAEETHPELIKYEKDAELRERKKAEAKEIEQKGYDSDKYYEQKLS